MSLGEIVLLLLVGIVVVGPRNLPTLMRTAGQWVARLRRMSTDLRSQSGIDEILRREGLDEHIHELRSLSRMNMVESLIAPVTAGAGSAIVGSSPAGRAPPETPYDRSRDAPLREREYPLLGCDAYGVLPDDAMSYRMMAQRKAAAAPAAPATPDDDARGRDAADEPAGAAS